MTDTSSTPRTRKPVRAAMVTAAVGLGISLGSGAAPASANVCTDHSPRLCLWEHSSYAPSFGSLSPAVGAGRSLGFLRGASNLHSASLRFGDLTSQIRNNSALAFCVYEHIDYKGRSRRIEPRSVHYFNTSWWNDKISSLKRC